LVGCAAVFADRRILRRFAAAFGDDIAVLTDEALAPGREPHWPDSIPVDPGSDAVLMFTSGTTSRPKAVRVTHGNIQANTNSIMTFLGLRSDDRVLVILPFCVAEGDRPRLPEVGARAWRSRNRHRRGGPYRGVDARQRNDVPGTVMALAENPQVCSVEFPTWLTLRVSG
jgi:hypothetical protein